MKDQIDYSDFEKMDMVVGEIMEVEEVEGADKLYKLSVNISEDEPRTLMAGIKEHYSIDELKGKRCVVLANLAPRTLKGVESKGMVLAAVSDDHSKVELVSPGEDVEIGSRVS